MTFSPRPFAFLPLLLALSPVAVLASGSYPPNPPRLGVSALAQIDARAYNLGKSLFIDRIKLPETTPAGADPLANRTRLEAVQDRLPSRVQNEVDLPSLAARLDRDQVDALLYYIGIRFRIEVSGSA